MRQRAEQRIAASLNASPRARWYYFGVKPRPGRRVARLRRVSAGVRRGKIHCTPPSHSSGRLSVFHPSRSLVPPCRAFTCRFSSAFATASRRRRPSSSPSAATRWMPSGCQKTSSTTLWCSCPWCFQSSSSPARRQPCIISGASSSRSRSSVSSSNTFRSPTADRSSRGRRCRVSCVRSCASRQTGVSSPSAWRAQRRRLPPSSASSSARPSPRRACAWPPPAIRWSSRTCCSSAVDTLTRTRSR